MSVVRLTVDRVAFRAGCGTFRLIATSASTAALEGEADMAGNGPKTTFMTHLDQCLESRQHNLL